MSLDTRPWKLRLICCGKLEGYEYFEEWQDADDFRKFYVTGCSPHVRVGIIEKNIWHAVEQAIARLPGWLRTDAE